jgi:hypothetical protein
MLFAAVTSRIAIQASSARSPENLHQSQMVRTTAQALQLYVRPQKNRMGIEFLSGPCRATPGGCEPRPSSDSMRFSLQPSSTALEIGARCLPGFCGTSRSNVSDHTSDHVNYSCCLIQPFQIGLNPLPTKSSNILWFQAHRKIEKRLQVIHTAYILLRAGIRSSTLALYLAMIPQIIKTHC